VGKPNVGKSSLFNRLLGEERSIVDAVPHTTRDAVDTMIELPGPPGPDGTAVGEPWVFVDTAGMRRRYRHGEDTELYSVDRTRAAIAQADLVLFVIDASEPLGEQDQRLAALLRDAGRGIVLVCNKWDEVDEDRRYDLERELDRLLSFASWAPRVNVSALTGRGLRRVVPQLRTVWDNYQRRIPTRLLNKLLEEAIAAHPPPRQGQKQLRIRYATQAEVARRASCCSATGVSRPATCATSSAACARRTTSPGCRCSSTTGRPPRANAAVEGPGWPAPAPAGSVRRPRSRPGRVPRIPRSDVRPAAAAARRRPRFHTPGCGAVR
jgi:small GTP-binding protein